MKTRILRIIILVTIVLGIVVLNGGFQNLLNPSTVRAFGDLVVDFHVPVGTPIFNVSNMKPGDSVSKPVDVTNNATVSRFVAVKGVRKSGLGADPKIETVLTIVIKDGTTIIYGPKTLADFFSDSSNLNEIKLNVINPSNSKTYNFQVTFPPSADNRFQAKSVVADLTFGIITGKDVVINEVYYQVDNNHGLDSAKDTRPTGTNGKKLGINNEWVELYNPTEKDISLKDWSLTDNSGGLSIIHSNKSIKSGGFVLLSKDASTWKYWSTSKSFDKLELGNQIGDGLDNAGDRLILKNSANVVVDRMSWGSDTSGFTPTGTNAVVATGSSTERLAPGFDTDAASDWGQKTPPTPGF